MGNAAPHSAHASLLGLIALAWVSFPLPLDSQMKLNTDGSWVEGLMNSSEPCLLRFASLVRPDNNGTEFQ
jgi:hypothetical protein